MYDELTDYHQFQWTIGMCFLGCPHCLASNNEILQELLILAKVPSND